MVVRHTLFVGKTDEALNMLCLGRTTETGRKGIENGFELKPQRHAILPYTFGRF